MNKLESRADEAILAGIRQSNETLANEIQDLMFIFDNLMDVDDKGIQVLLREVSTDNLVLALKGAEEQMKEKIFWQHVETRGGSAEGRPRNERPGARQRSGSRAARNPRDRAASRGRGRDRARRFGRRVDLTRAGAIPMTDVNDRSGSADARNGRPARVAGVRRAVRMPDGDAAAPARRRRRKPSTKTATHAGNAAGLAAAADEIRALKERLASEHPDAMEQTRIRVDAQQQQRLVELTHAICGKVLDLELTTTICASSKRSCAPASNTSMRRRRNGARARESERRRMAERDSSTAS